MAEKESESFESELAYDLRQYYARLVGLKIFQVDDARSNRRYPDYFKKLDELKVIVKHKFRDEDDQNEYKRLVDTALAVFNKYSSTYLGKASDPIGISEIDRVLGEIEMFLFRVMDEASMFGTKWNDDGL